MGIIFITLILVVHASIGVTGHRDRQERPSDRFRRNPDKCHNFVIANGFVHKNSNSVRVWCKTGYTLKPPVSVLKYKHVNGPTWTWTPSPPSCVKAASTDISKTSTIDPTPVMSETPTDMPTTALATTLSIPDPPQETKDSDVNPAYIWIPVVICVIAVITVVLCFLWRQKKCSPSVLKREKGTGSSFAHKTYEVKGIDRHCSLVNVRKSCDNGYAEISLDTLHPEEAQRNIYQTIDNLSEDKTGKDNDYGHLKQQTTNFIDMNYSHIKTNQNGKQSVIDTSYALTETAEKSMESKHRLDHENATYNRLEKTSKRPSDTTYALTISAAESNEPKYRIGDGNTTYNRLDNVPKSASEKNVAQGPVKDELEPEYNHARAGCPDPENTVDEYSHLNGSKHTLNSLTKEEKYQCKTNGNRSHNTEIEPYYFTKDVDNLNSTDMTKVVNQEYEILNLEYVGNSNNYTILKAEATNNVPSFREVENFPKDTADTTEHAEPAEHQYFVLDKINT